jgi:hypothetical protein
MLILKIFLRSRVFLRHYKTAAIMTKDEIKKLLYPDSFGHSIKDDLDWPNIHERLQTNKHFNLQYLWEEYKADNADGLSYTVVNHIIFVDVVNFYSLKFQEHFYFNIPIRHKTPPFLSR